MIPLAKPYLTSREAKAAYNTVLSHWVTQGPRVEEFEKKFASYVGSKYAVAVSNCTVALHLSLIVAGVGVGDEVICPSLSFIATANAIRYVGASPVFAEVDKRTYNIDADCAEKLINKKTKTILIVHQLGLAADIDRFKKLAKKYKLKIIEDAACAAGSMYKNKKIGSHSDLVCFSLHPKKVITTGEGGMITTTNKNYYERLQRLRQHGMSVSDSARHVAKKVIFEDYREIGYNFRMTDIQAAIGIEQLKKIEWIIRKRRSIAAQYNKAFKDIACLQLPQESTDYYFNYQTYMLYLRQNCPISRDALIQKLLDVGIATRRGLMAIHTQIVYKKNYKNIHLSVTEDLAERTISIPLYAQMRQREIDYVIKKIRQFVTS